MQNIAYISMFVFYLLLGIFAILMIRVAYIQNKILKKQLKREERYVCFLTGERGHGKTFAENMKKAGVDKIDKD